jgi:hypothetical protein
MTFLKTTALIGTVCLAAIFGYKYVTADPPGYCAAQGRYISDAEFIKAVGLLVERDMKSVSTTYPDGRKVSGKEKYVQWDKEWNGLNPRDPKFSTVERKRTHSIFNRILDLQRVDVRIGPESGGTLSFHFDVCGNLWESDIGLPNTAYRVITTTNIGGTNHDL